MKHINNTIHLIGILLNNPKQLKNKVQFSLKVEDEVLIINAKNNPSEVSMKYLQKDSKIAIEGYFKNNEIFIKELLVLNIKK